MLIRKNIMASEIASLYDEHCALKWLVTSDNKNNQMRIPALGSEAMIKAPLELKLQLWQIAEKAMLDAAWDRIGEIEILLVENDIGIECLVRK